MSFADHTWAVLCAVETGWAVRIWHLGLAGRHRFLVAFLLTLSLHELLDSFLVQVYGWGPPTQFPEHFLAWKIAQPILWLLMLLVVVEVFVHMLSAGGAPERLGLRAATGVAVSAALVMAVCRWFAEFQTFGNFLVRSEGNVNAVLAALVVLLWMCARGEADWNSKVVLAVFGALFLANVGIIVFRDVYGWEAGRLARYEIMPSVTVGLFLLGAGLFRGARNASFRLAG